MFLGIGYFLCNIVLTIINMAIIKTTNVSGSGWFTYRPF